MNKQRIKEIRELWNRGLEKTSDIPNIFRYIEELEEDNKRLKAGATENRDWCQQAIHDMKKANIERDEAVKNLKLVESEKLSDALTAISLAAKNGEQLNIICEDKVSGKVIKFLVGLAKKQYLRAEKYKKALMELQGTCPDDCDVHSDCEIIRKAKDDE